MTAGFRNRKFLTFAILVVVFMAAGLLCYEGAVRGWWLWPRHASPSAERYRLYPLRKALELYLADSGGVLPVVKEGETVIDALYPNYIELADEVKESIGMGGKNSYYVFRREFSGKTLAELPDREPIVVRTGVPLPSPRNDNLHMEIIKCGEKSLIVWTKEWPLDEPIAK